MALRKKTTGDKSRSKVARSAPPKPARKRNAAGAALIVFGALFLGSAAVVVLDLIDSHVDRLLVSRPAPDARLRCPGVPPVLNGLADDDIHDLLEPLLDEPWTTPDLCERMARLVEQVGWVRTLHNVRRLADGSFEVSCEYREPLAIVSQSEGYVLVDADQVRLPGVYAYHNSWIVVDGVRQPPPPPGRIWTGEDLRAGLTLVKSLREEPFTRQITAVLVDNYGGRVDKYASHIELATDRAGGRIRWGSAPGAELEENSVDHKTAILRANYARTGRLDANHPLIDISTFADRFTVPG